MSGQEGVTFAVKWHKRSCRRIRDTEKCKESKTFWSLVSYNYVLVRDIFAWLWSGGREIGDASDRRLLVWDEEKPPPPGGQAGPSQARPGCFFFFFGRAMLGLGGALHLGNNKRKEARPPASLSTCRKCSRTPAVLAPLSGSGRPCGPPCSRSLFQAAAAWGRTRWPRSGWSYGFPHRGRSPWRER